MAGYGQFCAIARAHEVLGGRWTLLVVRELLCGSRRFNDIRRGIPRISRTMLSERLKELTLVGAVKQTEGAHGPEYEPTEAGQELFALLEVLGTWGQRWLPRKSTVEDADLEPLLVDMRRRVRFEKLPKDPMVVRFEIAGNLTRFMLLKSTEASLCTHNPGFPEPLCIRGPLAALIAWWRGDASFTEAQRLGLSIDGRRSVARAFPDWFERYLFADVGSTRKPMNGARPSRSASARQHMRKKVHELAR